MNLFLRFQLEEHAWKKWGSPEALDAEFEKRGEDAQKRRTKKFKAGLRELKKKTLTDKFRRNLKNGGSGGNFGDRLGDAKHLHKWGIPVENADGMSVETCTECGMENEMLIF